MSNTRYWLLVLLIPLFGVFLLGGIGTVELALWLALAALWTVAFIKDGLKAWVSLVSLGVLVALGAGFAIYNNTSADAPRVTVDRG
ncbi:MAG TPA: hypothetical protein VLB29_18375 [Nocardioidaceae bacterium]|nr:hypothetical protein [Nocardioidaceae bacterium]